MTVPAIILLAPHSNLGFPLYMAYNIHNFESPPIGKFNVNPDSELFKLKGTKLL